MLLKAKKTHPHLPVQPDKVGQEGPEEGARQQDWHRLMEALGHVGPQGVQGQTGVPQGDVAERRRLRLLRHASFSKGPFNNCCVLL